MIERILIAIVLLISSINLSAQTETLLSEGIEKKVQIKYNFDKVGASNNRMIEFVAKAKALPEHAAKLVYDVKEHRKVIKNGNKLQLQLSVGNFVFADDISYLSFEINNYLHPTLISYTYVFADENDNVIETKTVENAKFKNGSYLLKKSVDNTQQSNTYQLYLSELSMRFSDDDVSTLATFMEIVDDYYNADAHLNLLEQEMAKIRKDSIEMLESYRQITIDNIKVLNQIRAERFASKLRLDSNDPIQFKSHFGRVEVQNRGLKKELEKTLDNMHITYYLKGKDWQNWNDIEKATAYFNKSIQEKYKYPPPHFELAQFSFNNGLYDQAIDSCAMILNKMKPDTDTRFNAVKLAESVIYKYIDEIYFFIENREFAKAVESLKICENYSKSIPGVKYFEEFSDIQGKLYKAYYLDLVDVTMIQIDNMQLTKAQFNVDSLAQFRKTHPQYILNPEKEHELLKLLYAAWMETGINFMENQIPDSSLYAFTQATIICNKHEVVYCTEELKSYISQARIGQYNYMIMQAGQLIEEQFADSAITRLNEAELFRSQNNLEKNLFVETLLIKGQQLKYASLIQTGANAFGNKKVREALAFYDEAAALEKAFTIEVDTTLRHKTVEAAQSYIAFLCIQGETLVEALHIVDANQKLHAAKNIYTYYSLENDEESTKAIVNLKEKLKEGKCDKVSYNYNIQIIAAQKFIEQKEFIYAWNALEKAKRISRNNSDCSLADSINSRLSNAIRAMLHYQKKIIEIDELLEQKSYAKLIDLYAQLTTFYNDSCENNFGITHKPLYAYIVSHSNTGVIDFSVKFYTEMGKTDTALIMLNTLHDREYVSSWSKESQIALGTQLALKDLEVEEETDPKIKVIDYTKADRWYNHLKKAYLAQWKIK
ncbi:MAG: hypothetical protein PF517_03305 [Salinivirgaceae bacterium]|jgi:hypothetical protein|nr:hypothetical protein [Salinivirgaceae bacterium]